MEFSEFINKIVTRLFLVVWTPWGENKELDIDISFGFVFKEEPSRLYIISVDKDELWSPHIFNQSLPDNVYLWEDFYPKIKMWVNSYEDSCTITYEYFDVTDSELFKDIVNSEIIGIESIIIEGNEEPFGIKILFNKDYIISTPISDGNTVETSKFNQNNNIEIFKRLGKVKYITII